MIWGGLSLLAVIAIGAFVAFQIGPGNRDKNDSASRHDVRFVLNWCRLGDDRIQKVVHSHVSSRSFTGSHLDAYAIKITHVDPSELDARSGELRRWYRGDRASAIVNDGLEFMGMWLDAIPWFPKQAELRSSSYYIYPQHIDYHGIKPAGVEMIFVRPSDKMVFYFDGKM